MTDSEDAITPSDGATVTPDSLVRPVILCGGSGSRLWPLSSSFLPKQLLVLHSHQSMLQETVRRVAGDQFEAPIVITGAEHRIIVQDQLRASQTEASAIILEPEGRNTAAAIAIACFFEAATDPDHLMLVMPSDHVIGDAEAFRRSVRVGVPAAATGAIVTFGIKATRGDTGYGYVQAGEEVVGHPGVRRALRFVEKPPPATAVAYSESGNYCWNGGIFLFKASTLIGELRAFAPEIASACEAAMQNADADGDFLRPAREDFLTAPSNSIDYAVMEKTDRACVVEVDMGWSDVGSWDAMWEISDKDEQANAIMGNVVTMDASGSLIRNECDVTIAALGIENLVIVATQDAILIVPRDRSQEVKDLVQGLGQVGTPSLKRTDRSDSSNG